MPTFRCGRRMAPSSISCRARCPTRWTSGASRPAGGTPERMTAHDSQVSHPVFLNQRTLMYLATTAGGSRAALYALDLERRVPHRVSFGLEQYTSLAASADGRRLVATVAQTKSTLWRVPISDQVAEESAASPMTLPTGGGLSPRLGGSFLLYVSSRGGREGIWKLAAGTATELWTAPNARIVGGPSIARDGRGSRSWSRNTDAHGST